MKMKSENSKGGSFSADSASGNETSKNGASRQEASKFVGQGKLYAPPSGTVSTSEHESKGARVPFYYEGVTGGDNNPNSKAGGDASLKLAVEKAMEKLKGSVPTESFDKAYHAITSGSVPTESFDKAYHAITSAFSEAGSSTKDAIQRITARLADVLPSSNHAKIEKIVEDVQQQVLNKSEAAEISSKL